MVHCLLTPVVLSLSAVSAHFLPSEEKTHRTLAVAIAALGAIALVRGYRRHRSWRVLALMAVGLACIFGGAFWGDHLPSHGVEVLITLIGSGFMIAAPNQSHILSRLQLQPLGLSTAGTTAAARRWGLTGYFDSAAIGLAELQPA